MQKLFIQKLRRKKEAEQTGDYENISFILSKKFFSFLSG